MKKTAMAATLAALLLSSQVQAAGPSARTAVAAEEASTSLSLLSEYDTQALDRIATGASASAVIALRCSGKNFEATSRQIQNRFMSMVDAVGAPRAAAQAYAQDWAGMKYKAIAGSTAGQGCESLGRLRMIANENGFSD